MTNYRDYQHDRHLHHHFYENGLQEKKITRLVFLKYVRWSNIFFVIGLWIGLSVYGFLIRRASKPEHTNNNSHDNQKVGKVTYRHDWRWLLIIIITITTTTDYASGRVCCCVAWHAMAKEGHCMAYEHGEKNERRRKKWINILRYIFFSFFDFWVLGK